MDCRCILEKGDIISIKGTKYCIDSILGRGASSICYKAKEANSLDNKWFVVKEFYPLNLAIRTEDNNIYPLNDNAGRESWKNAQDRWGFSIEIQKKFPSNGLNNFMEIKESDDRYVVMWLREGITLREWVEKKYPQDKDDELESQYIKQCLDILRDICACVEWYQQNGQIHFDIKPDNIFLLKDNNEKWIVRLIDYDSLKSKEEFLELVQTQIKIPIYSTGAYYGEEVNSESDRWKRRVTEDSWKQIDVYAIGRVFCYMLTKSSQTENLDDLNFSWFSIENIPIKTTSIRREVLINFINRTCAIFGKRYYDAKTLKFIVENIQGLFNNYNYEMFDGFNEYRVDLVPELIVEGQIYTPQKIGKSPLEMVFEDYVVGKNKNICLVAESGMGKSTALRKLFLTKILENQHKSRFYYYPLRKCRSVSDAKRLQRGVENLYNYCEFDDTKKYFLLDAFDEMNQENKDLQKEIKCVLENGFKEANVILTSRFEIDGIGYNCVKTGKLGIKHFDEQLNRIHKNSPWLQDAGNDIFCNPLYISMAENFEKIKNYIIHDKETGELAWNKIEKELVGEYSNGMLTVNYAGELIWNYIFATVLLKYVNTNQFSDVTKLMHNYVFWYMCAQVYIFIGDKAEGAIDLYEICLNIIGRVDNGNGECATNVYLLKELLKYIVFGFMRNNHIFYDIVCGIASVHDQECKLPDYKKYIFGPVFECLGFSYNKIKEEGDICIGNIPKEIVKSYPNVFYLGGKEYAQKIEVQLSDFQKNNRFIVYKWIQEELMTHGENEESVLRSLLRDMRQVSYLNISDISLRHFCFHKVSNCHFYNCLIQVKSGEFSNCVFENLAQDSYLLEKINNNNQVDQIYGIWDESGNCVSSDGTIALVLRDYNAISEKNKEKLKKITRGALDSCINKKLIFYSNLDEINFRSALRNDYLRHSLKEMDITIFGNAHIIAPNMVRNLSVYQCERMTISVDCINYSYIQYMDGIIYGKVCNKDEIFSSESAAFMKEKLYIIHVNRDLPKKVTSLSIDFLVNYAISAQGCEELTLPYFKGNSHTNLVNKSFIKSFCQQFVGLKKIRNIPIGFLEINGLIFKQVVMEKKVIITPYSNEVKESINKYEKMKEAGIIRPFPFETNEIIYILDNQQKIIYIPEDLGIFLDWSWISKNLGWMKCKKFFRPYSKTRLPEKIYIKCDNEMIEIESPPILDKNSFSKDIPWDHSIDGYFSDSFNGDTFEDYCESEWVNEEYVAELKSKLKIIDVYDELTEEDRENVNNQREEWKKFILKDIESKK